MTRLEVEDLCSYCKKGKMEFHYSTRGVKLGENSAPTSFWKCDNQKCAHVLPCNKDDL